MGGIFQFSGDVLYVLFMFDSLQIKGPRTDGSARGLFDRRDGALCLGGAVLDDPVPRPDGSDECAGHDDPECNPPPTRFRKLLHLLLRSRGG